MTWAIDPSHSHLEFSAKHMMISTVRGRFEKFDVALDLDDQNPTRAAVEVTVDVNSLTTGEARRDAHLKSPDFFDAETYPNLTFRSTRIESAGAGQFKLIGDLTIKDQTRQITLNVTEEGSGTDPWGGKRLAYSATATLNRKDWGLNWNVALETGGWLVGDQIKIAVDVEVVAQVPQAVGA
jgi:polyisoprenoid-binding protein YceI